MVDDYKKVMPRPEIRGGGPLSDPEGIAQLEHDAARAERIWRQPPKHSFGEVFDEVAHPDAEDAQGIAEQDPESKRDEEDADHSQSGSDPAAPQEVRLRDVSVSRLPPDPRMAVLNAQLNKRQNRSSASPRQRSQPAASAKPVGSKKTRRPS